MKTAAIRNSIAIACVALAAGAVSGCVSDSQAVAPRVEALNMNPPPSMPTQQPTLVWVPGHYDARGAWVPGRWRKI